MLATDLKVSVQFQVYVDLARAAADRYLFLVKLSDFGCGCFTIAAQPTDLNRKNRILRRPGPDNGGLLIFFFDHHSIKGTSSLIGLAWPYYRLRRRGIPDVLDSEMTSLQSSIDSQLHRKGPCLKLLGTNQLRRPLGKNVVEAALKP